MTVKRKAMAVEAALDPERFLRVIVADVYREGLSWPWHDFVTVVEQRCAALGLRVANITVGASHFWADINGVRVNARLRGPP